MASFDKENLHKLTDDQLFKELKKCGLTAGPITSTTRSIYEKRLKSYLEKNSTLTQEKSNAKPVLVSKIPVVENLTSTAAIEKTLVQPANDKPKILSQPQHQPQKLQQQPAQTININIHNSNSTNHQPSSTQTEPSLSQAKPKNVSEPVSTTSKSLADIKQIQNRKIDQLTSSLSQTHTKQYNAYDNLIKTSDHLKASHVEKDKWSNEHVYASIPSTLDEFKARPVAERSPQRKLTVAEILSQRPSTSSKIENKETPSLPAQPNYQILRGSLPKITTTAKDPIESINSKTFTQEVSSTQYDSRPQIIPNKFSSSPVINHRLYSDKYLERAQNYGLLTTPVVLPSSSTSLNTPNTIRARAAMHTPKSVVLTQAAMKTTPLATRTSVVQISLKNIERTNWTWYILAAIVVGLSYWIFVSFSVFGSNPSNPLLD